MIDNKERWVDRWIDRNRNAEILRHRDINLDEACTLQYVFVAHIHLHHTATALHMLLSLPLQILVFGIIDLNSLSFLGFESI